MRQKENYTRHVALALILTLAVLASFQIYIWGEPGRIAAVEAHDKEVAVAAGQALFQKNCTLCHGNNGEGDIGPSLNDKKFLDNTADDQIFSIVSSGVPNTQMPAWNQSHGGPLTDEDVTQLVAFVRSWQPAAPDRSLQPLVGDVTRGTSIYNNVCAICHGANGVGSDRGTALNDPAKLSQFDDAWYKNTIEQGRPAKGMPTWGTVLAPQQIADVLAVIDKWRANPAAAITPTPVPTSTTGTTQTVEVARPSNPGDAGPAINLTGDPTSGAQIFVTSCQKCHGDKGTGGVNNPGSNDGTVPPLNPIDSSLIDSNAKVYATNLDLFLEHGSTPAGPNPQLSMPAWGDQKKLAPQQIADVIAYVMSLNPAPIPTATPTPAPPVTPTPTVEAAQPSNPGGPGSAIGLTGDPTAGAPIFVTNCQKCHGPTGTGGVNNPGSNDGTVPPLNPIDSSLIDSDAKVYATNLDLFLEHGSTPAGPNPQLKMPAWGDAKTLTPQQIADVIAYVMSLNPAPVRPSNPGDVGPAMNLTGDATSGQQIYVANCQKCHGDKGTGGVANPGSDDGTVPPLNPIDSTLINSDLKVFAANVDLFLEHGSTPAGPNPQLKMPAWGESGKLTPQQIADAIAYVMSLNAK